MKITERQKIGAHIRRAIPILLVCKLISLLLLATISGWYSSAALQTYFQTSILSALISSMIFLGLLLKIQTSGISEMKKITFISGCVGIFSVLTGMFLGVNYYMLYAVSMQATIILVITFCYRIQNQLLALYVQAFFVIIQQPLILIGSNLIVGSLYFYYPGLIFSLCGLLIMLLIYLKQDDHPIIFIERSCEIVLVSAYSYYIYQKGFYVSKESQIILFWILLQLGNAFVFFGNSITFYLIPELSNASNNSVKPTRNYFKYISFVSAIQLMTIIIFPKSAIYMFCFTLMISGVTKGFTASLLAQGLTRIILIANLSGPIIGLIIELLFPIKDFSGIIIFTILNNFVAAFIYQWKLQRND